MQVKIFITQTKSYPQLQKKLMKKTGNEEGWEEEGDELEEDPEEWIDRVADEVEEKRLQKMQALEKPEGSTEGIRFLTTRNVYDWRKKPYHHEDGTTTKRWKIRSRLVAREFAFAEGKRDDVFSPAISGHVLKLLHNTLAESQQEREEEHFPRR